VTARMMPLESICCAADCGKLGAYTVGARVYAITDPNKQRGSLDIETTMVACEDHRQKMPTTAAEFFHADDRERITHALRATGRPAPNYDGAEWVHEPIPGPAKEAAH
jgi:hypothetical protein